MDALAHLKTPSLEPWTTRGHGSGNDDDLRDPFARDRDRILHSRAFRRLQHKTQVIIVTEGDDYRTRITHSLEVAQIARSIARALGLSEPLAEAIALGHTSGTLLLAMRARKLWPVSSRITMDGTQTHTRCLFLTSWKSSITNIRDLTLHSRPEKVSHVTRRLTTILLKDSPARLHRH